MLGLIIVLIAGLALAGFLIGVVVISTKKQSNQIADRIAQADQLIAKARRWSEEPHPPTLTTTNTTKPAIQPAVQP